MHKAHTHNASTPFIGCLAHLVEKKLGGFIVKEKKCGCQLVYVSKKKEKKKKKKKTHLKCGFGGKKEKLFCKKKITW
jgi:hypothetical protein